jgi:acyl-CoA thioesterase
LASPDKAVKTVHAIFARAGTVTQPIDYERDPMHAGRTFASETITAWQGDRLCSRAMLLLHAEEPDLVRHGIAMPDVGGPMDAVDQGASGLVFPGAELRIVDGVDIWSHEAPEGPAEFFVWTRFPDAPGDPAVAQAALAWATDGLLIGTALRPHGGVGQDQAHIGISTGVVSHTLTFHEPFDARGWLLIAHDSLYAGRGRSYGRAQVFTEDGALVASFVQDNMIRQVAGGGSLDGRTSM